MSDAAPTIAEIDFLRSIARDAAHVMWFLGAGTSRSSGLPTASDITWDLKRNLYCLEQNQDIARHDWSNKAVQARIQSYVDGKGYPPLWDPAEYSFYFERTFGTDYAAQQAYLREALNTAKISLTIGPRALAGMLAMNRSPLAFTTNFDEILETAFAAVAGRNLSTFHLEGSYAALAALNAGQFPFYAKVHGDFRYQSVKNLSADLLSNDLEVQKAFLAAATRFGVIVSGYSGRDENVMKMFREAVDQNNAFSHGLYWTVPNASRVSPKVHELLAYAQSKGMKCGIVRTGTFDEMMSKIWKALANRPLELDAKVRSAIAAAVSIPLPALGTAYPMLRTNALLVTRLPDACATVDVKGEIKMGAIRSKMFETHSECTLAYTDRLLFWGSRDDVVKVAEGVTLGDAKAFALGDLTKSVHESGVLKGFVEETLARALVHGKPLLLRRADRTWYAVADHKNGTNDLYKPLRAAIGKGTLPAVHGPVFGLTDVFWAEAVALHLEERNGSLWLMLRPEVWITPLAERDAARDSLRARKRKRYNAQSFDILSAWIRILLGDLGGTPVKVTAFPDKENSALFEITTRTAYSKKSA
jgi:hypothetical protein